MVVDDLPDQLVVLHCDACLPPARYEEHVAVVLQVLSTTNRLQFCVATAAEMSPATSSERKAPCYNRCGTSVTSANQPSGQS